MEERIIKDINNLLTQLFQKMKEAGYEWNAEKKELRKIEQNLAWSEEDDEMFDAIIADIQFTQKAHAHEVNQVVYERKIDWLKDLKERVQPQQEWSEDVEAAIRLLKNIAEEQEKDYCPYNANHLRKAAQYLEACRP